MAVEREGGVSSVYAERESREKGSVFVSEKEGGLSSAAQL